MHSLDNIFCERQAHFDIEALKCLLVLGEKVKKRFLNSLLFIYLIIFLQMDLWLPWKLFKK